MQNSSLPILEKLVQELHPCYLVPGLQDECFMASVLSRIRDEVMNIKDELLACAATLKENPQQLQWYVRVHQQVVLRLQHTLQAYIHSVKGLPGCGEVCATLYSEISSYLDTLVLVYLADCFADHDIQAAGNTPAAFSTSTSFSIAGLRVKWRLFFSAIFQVGRARHPQQHYRV